MNNSWINQFCVYRGTASSTCNRLGAPVRLSVKSSSTLTFEIKLCVMLPNLWAVMRRRRHVFVWVHRTARHELTGAVQQTVSREVDVAGISAGSKIHCGNLRIHKCFSFMQHIMHNYFCLTLWIADHQLMTAFTFSFFIPLPSVLASSESKWS